MKQKTLGPIVLALFCSFAVPTLAADAAATKAQNAFADFQQFCADSFGAMHEELVYAASGKDLALLDEGLWEHGSLNSACVGFETNLPAKAHVEYGKDESFGRKTEPYRLHHYIHVHCLRGLEPNTEYRYRIVAVDEKGREIRSAVRTIRTIQDKDIVKVPGDMPAGPLYKLASGKKYVLTQDLMVDGAAFEAEPQGKSITLDLNGFTVVYNNRKMGPIQGDFWAWARESAVGVRMMKGQGLRVLNGSIIQGAGQDAAQGNSIGFNPIYTSGVSNMELAGLTIEYGGAQQVGIFNHYSGYDSRIHHNVLRDTGTEIPNRHGSGSRAIYYFDHGKGGRIDRNLVLRTRQSGVNAPDVHNNEIYVDSWSTNSFAVGGADRVHHNRIFGTGYHFVGVGWSSGMEVHHNFIHAQGQMVPGRFHEYGETQSSVNGIRLTQYAGAKKPYENNSYHDNVIVVASRGGAQARGVQFFSDPNVRNLTFRKNIIKAVSQDANTDGVACVVTQGNHASAEQHEPILYEDCTFISNRVNIRFGDYYGVGCNHRFARCRIVKSGDDPRYRTFNFDNGYPSDRHVLADCVFEGGAAPASVGWPEGDAAKSSFSLAWTLTVRTVPGGRVQVKDNAGAEVAAGVADAAGVFKAVLKQQTAAKAGVQVLTPHVVSVQAGGRTATKSVEMTRAIEIEVRPQ